MEPFSSSSLLLLPFSLPLSSSLDSFPLFSPAPPRRTEREEEARRGPGGCVGATRGLHGGRREEEGTTTEGEGRTVTVAGEGKEGGGEVEASKEGEGEGEEVEG